MMANLKTATGAPLGTSLDSLGSTASSNTELDGPAAQGREESTGGRLRRGNTVTTINASGEQQHRVSPRLGKRPETREHQNQPELPIVEKVSKCVASRGIPVVQFRTVQLPDGKLQLQRRGVRFVKDADSNTKLRIVRATPPNQQASKNGHTVIQTVVLRQIQRVLLGAETMTMKRAVKDIPLGSDVKPVDERNCLSLIYADEYLDFEVSPDAGVKAEEFKLWLVHVCVDESMEEPPPPPDEDYSPSYGLAKLRHKKDDFTTDAQNFYPAIEYCRLPPLTDEIHRYSTKTSALDADVVGSVSCHGVEPNMDEGSMSRRPADTIHAKKNQDAGAVVCPLLGDDMSTALFAVFDGHGEEGHHVSNYCIRRISEFLQKHRKSTLTEPGRALRNAYIQANDTLAHSHSRWGNHGGTTAVCVLVLGTQCWIANCGDSRFTIGVRAENSRGIPVANDVSVDQTPLEENERERITAAGGFVAQDENESEARVWLDRDMTCGLAMSRSLGDLPFKMIGVTAEPEITKHTFHSSDEFLIGASDGVWSVMSSQEAVELVHNVSRGFGSEQIHALRAAQELIRESARRWKEEEGDYRDDITAIVIKVNEFLTRKVSHSASSTPNSRRRNSAPMMRAMKRGSATRSPPPARRNTQRKSMTSAGSNRKISL